MRHLVAGLTGNGQDGLQDRTQQLERLVSACRDIGLDTTRFIWTWDRFKSTHLYRSNPGIFVPQHHLGYWMWKPYILSLAMSECQVGDVLVYFDSDLNPCNDKVKEILNMVPPEKAVFISYDYPNGNWTTEQCLKLMGMNTPYHRETNHLWAGVHFWQVCPETRRLALDWFTYCSNLEILRGGVGDSYKEKHRWDQSVLTNLVAATGWCKVLGNEWAAVASHPPY